MTEDMVLSLAEVKEILIPSMFPSEEDGNPDDYEIIGDYGLDEVIIRRKHG